MPGLNGNISLIDLDPTKTDFLKSASALLAQSVHDSIKGLVPYHAVSYSNYLKAALGLPALLRTVLVRVVVVDGILAGVADWRILPGELFLNGLAVAKYARRAGLARRLLTDGFQIADNVGARRLGLDVVVQNSVAMSFYSRIGFVVASESYWYEIAPLSVTSKISSARALNWPAFQAHKRAYGFGDLSVRGPAETAGRIRVVGSNIILDENTQNFAMLDYRGIFGAERIVSTAPQMMDNHVRQFSRSARMRHNG